MMFNERRNEGLIDVGASVDEGVFDDDPVDVGTAV
jgi:hypothetical protein